jgi:hypothetical protein
MKPTIYLRIAAALTLIHCLGHTARSMLSGPTHGAQETSLIQAMQAATFNFSGVNRSYWDFQRGFGWFLTVELAVQAVVFWILASLAKNPSIRLRPIFIVFAISFLAMAGLSVRYFTPGPVVVEVLIAMSFIGAIVSASNNSASLNDS